MDKKLRNIFNNDFFFIIVILLISLLIFRLPLISKGYPSWADNSSPLVLNMSNFRDLSDFTYAEHFNGLVYNANLIITYFLLNKAFILFHVVFTNIRILSFLWIFLPYLTLYLGLYLAFKNIFRSKPLSFLLTLFYIFSPLNFSQISYGWNTTLYSQAGGFIFISFLIKYLKYPKVKYIIAMSLSSLVGLMNIAHFYGVLFWALLYFISYVLINRIKFQEILKRYKNLLVFPISILTINTYWVLPTIFMARGVNFLFNFENIYSSTILTFFNTFNFITSFALSPNLSEIFSFFNSVYYRIFFSLFYLITFYYVVKNISKSKFMKLLFILYLLFFSFSLGENFELSWDVIQKIPGSFLIRSPQLKFFPLLFFSLSLLIGFIIQKYKPKIFIGLIYLAVMFGIFGFYKGNLFSYWSNVVLPADYSDVEAYLSNPDNRHETVMKFPMTRGSPMIKWRSNIYSYPIINYMFNNPLIVQNWGDSMVPVYLRSVYTDLNLNLAEVIGRGGVRYILVHKDYSQWPVLNDFVHAKGIALVSGGENIALYKVSNEFYKSLFFSSEKNLEFKRISPVMHLVNAKPGDAVTFNRQYDISLQLYDKKDLVNAGYYKCKFMISQMNLCDILLLRIKSLQKQPLSEDYKNNWLLPENTSGSYVVYYKPQIFFYVGLTISFFSFMIQSFYLLLKRDRDIEEEPVFN